MKRKTAPPKNRSLRTFVLFCVVVGVLILGSLTIKTFQSINQSIYDPKHSFVISVTSPQNLTIFGIDPKDNTVGVLQISNHGKVIASGRDIGVATDATLTTRKEPAHLRDLFPTIFFHGGKLTWYDAFRIFLVTSKMPETQAQITLGPDQTTTEYSPENLFTDQTIIDEGVTIGVVNATGVVGMGARLERVLDSLGANVVSVTTAQLPRLHSEIQYTTGSSYTLKRVSRLLRFPLSQSNDQGVSDIMITVGKDAISTTIF